MKLTTRFTSNG